MGTYKIDLEALSELPDSISATISDFGELEIEDLSDMISETRQSLKEIVVRAEERLKNREMQLRAAIQARINAEEMARNSEDGSMEVSSYYYENEMRCREELENARELFETIRNIPLTYDDRVDEYYRRIDGIKDDYRRRIEESNRDINDYIARVIHQHQEGGTYEDIGTPSKVGYFNEALGQRAGETKTLSIMHPSGEVYNTITDLSDGKCYRMTTIPSFFIAMSLNKSNTTTITGPVSVTKESKGIKYRIRERRPASSNSKQFAGVHMFQYPSIASGTVEQFDDFLKNELRTRAPFSVAIPIGAFITAEQMNNGYDQVKYEWSSEGYEYTCRWHTPTKAELQSQGDTWIMHRTSTATNNKTEYLVDGEWVSKKDFMNSDEYRKLGHLKDEGVFKSILGEEV